MDIKKINTLDELLELHQTTELHGFYDVPDEVYFHPDCPGVSRSYLNGINISPRHWYVESQKPKEEKNCFRVGTAVHMALLEPEKFEKTYVVLPQEELKKPRSFVEKDRLKEIVESHPILRSYLLGPRGGLLTGSKLNYCLSELILEHPNINECHEYQEMFKPTEYYSSPDKVLEISMAYEQAHGVKVVTEQEMKMIKVLSKFLETNQKYNTFFPRDKTNYEITAFVKCPQTGALLKAKIDMLNLADNKAYIGDYKTCRPRTAATMHSLQRWFAEGVDASAQSKNSRPYIQQAFYKYILACLGYDSQFIYVMGENDLPYDSRIVIFDTPEQENWVIIGMAHVIAELKTYAKCISENRYPGYSDCIEVEFPKYLEKHLDDDEDFEDE